MVGRQTLVCIGVLLLLNCCVLADESDSSCTNVNGIGQVCAQFSIDGCDATVSIEVTGEVVYSTVSDISSFSQPEELCATLTTTYSTQCDLCFGWESEVLQNGTATGCITLYGSCIGEDEHMDLGCFTDNQLQSCPGVCPDDCNGNGVCQFNGVCDCKVGFAGVSCYSECQDRTDTITRLIQDEPYTINSFSGDSLCYFHAIDDSAVASVSLTASSSTSSVTLYTLKSCYPDPETALFDDEVQLSADSTVTIYPSENCDDVAGGVWFVLARCNTANCQLTITAHQTSVSELEFSHTYSEGVSTEMDYYYFHLSSTSPFTLDVTTSINAQDLTVELLIGECPTDHIMFQHASAPSYYVAANDNSPGYSKYVLSDTNAQQGYWYVRISNPSGITVSYELTVVKSLCNQCQNGICSSGGRCTCFNPYWGGLNCDQYIGPTGPTVSPSRTISLSRTRTPVAQPSSEPSSSPTPTPTVLTDSYFHQGETPDSMTYYFPTDGTEGLSGGAIVGIVAAVTTAVVVLLVVVVAVILVAIRLRGKKEIPSDTLYNMITQEQDLDAF